VVERDRGSARETQARRMLDHLVEAIYRPVEVSGRGGVVTPSRRLGARAQRAAGKTRTSDDDRAHNHESEPDPTLTGAPWPWPQRRQAGHDERDHGRAGEREGRGGGRQRGDDGRPSASRASIEALEGDGERRDEEEADANRV